MKEIPDSFSFIYPYDSLLMILLRPLAENCKEGKLPMAISKGFKVDFHDPQAK